jgi:transglutaminase-like putative cysteine protease
MNLSQSLVRNALPCARVVYSIEHRMNFSYGGPAVKNRNQVRLCPTSDERQHCHSFELQTDPPGDMREQEDRFGNRVYDFEIRRPHQYLHIESRSIVEIAREGANYLVDLPLAALATPEIWARPETAAYLGPSPYVPYVGAVEEFVVAAEKLSEGSTSAFVAAAAELIRSGFPYRPGVTQTSSSFVDMLQAKSGVCQDFAHLLIAILRWRGVPARYVSGYLVPEYLSDPLHGGDRLFRTTVGHAWVEFFLPAGWAGVDPTLGITPKLRHVRIARGRDYSDAAPITGVYHGHPRSHLQSMIEISTLKMLDAEVTEAVRN